MGFWGFGVLGFWGCPGPSPFPRAFRNSKGGGGCGFGAGATRFPHKNQEQHCRQHRRNIFASTRGNMCFDHGRGKQKINDDDCFAGAMRPSRGARLSVSSRMFFPSRRRWFFGKSKFRAFCSARYSNREAPRPALR